MRSVTKAIQLFSLSFESIDHVCGHDCLPLGMFSVGHSISHHILKEHSQYCSDLGIKDI